MGKCSCEFPRIAPDGTSSDVEFDWEGFWITQPNVSECTRFFVNPVICYGEAFLKWLSTRSGRPHECKSPLT